MEKEDQNGLTGKILLAMPGMGDPRFHRAVIVLCAHDSSGAMGIVINHTLPGVDFGQLISQMDIDVSSGDRLPPAGRVPVINGGPVENTRGFILHSADFMQEGTIRIDGNISVTGTVDALRAVAEGKGPDQMIFALGYSGWGPGQLDRELQDNVWLVFDCDPEIVFGVAPDKKWEQALRRMGMDPLMLSSRAGRA